MDPRATQLAEIIVNHSIKTSEGDNVVISMSDFVSQDLARECYRLSLEKGANVHLDVMGLNYMIGRADAGGFYNTFLATANEKQLKTSPEMMEKLVDWGDKFIRLTTISNRDFTSNANKNRLGIWRDTFDPIFRATVNKTWLLTYFPTIGTAQNAKMSLEEFTDFYYAASIVDYEAQGAEIKKLADILDEAKQVHITGENVDLKLGINGRLFAGAISGTHNIPDGECFTGPEEDKTEGYIKFEYPQNYGGTEVTGAYFHFKEGKVTDFGADSGADYLENLFESNSDNMRLGELGIGMNKNITKYMKDTLFDEKIYGTIHLAFGQSYEEERGGGKNGGNIHWDMVKDLRHQGSSIEVDGKQIFADGEYKI